MRERAGNVMRELKKSSGDQQLRKKKDRGSKEGRPITRRPSPPIARGEEKASSSTVGKRGATQEGRGVGEGRKRGCRLMAGYGGDTKERVRYEWRRIKNEKTTCLSTPPCRSADLPTWPAQRKGNGDTAFRRFALGGGRKKDMVREKRTRRWSLRISRSEKYDQE